MAQVPFGARPNSSVSFGGRASPAPPAAGAVSLRSWPVVIEKSLGGGAKVLVAPLAVVLAIKIVPQLIGGLSLVEIMLNTSTGLVAAGVGAFVAWIWFMSRGVGRLKVDASGIEVVQRGVRSVYAWRDVEHIDEVKNAVKISLHGRSDEQNGYNLISARFADSAGALRQLLSEGQAQFAGRTGAGPQTSAPGDDLKAARFRSAKQIGTIFAAPVVLLFIAGLVWQVDEYLKTTDLRAYGQRDVGVVTKIYTECGRSSCSLNARYTYTPLGATRTYTAHAFLASDRDPNDPELVHARQSGSVPIVYDRRKPSVVETNFRNNLFSRDPLGMLLMMTGVFAAMAGFMALLFGLPVMSLVIKAYRSGNDPKWLYRPAQI